MLNQIINEHKQHSPAPHAKGRYAYVTFMIMNDSFLSGALMFAHGLQKQNVQEDIVCLVSTNVSKGAVDNLHNLFDKVIKTDEVYVKNDNHQGRQDRPFLFSRFNALRLGKDGDLKQNYKKIILCDADLYPLKKYSSLFALKAPAGIINESKENCMEYDSHGHYIIGDAKQTGKWCWHRKYDSICPHGEVIPKSITDRVQNDYDNMGVNASLWILEPSFSEYMMIINNVRTERMSKMISKFKWPEMQYATLRYSGQWTNVDLKYSSFNGYPCVDAVNGLHYAGTKPWKYKDKRHLKFFFSYPDYYLWYTEFLNMMNTNNRLFLNKKLSKIYCDVCEAMEEM